MKHDRRLILAFFLAAFAGCGGTTAETGGNTSWLGSCQADSDCDDAQCVDGVCAPPCADASTCSNLSADARCFEVVTSACAGAPGETLSVCLPGCNASDDCAAFGATLTCVEGHCAPPPTRCASRPPETPYELPPGYTPPTPIDCSDGPTASPFTNLYFRGDCAVEVQIDDSTRWYTLVAIDGHSFVEIRQAIVDVCQGDAWMNRFAEDLAIVMEALGSPMGDVVTLELIDEAGDYQRVEGVPNTAEKRDGLAGIGESESAACPETGDGYTPDFPALGDPPVPMGPPPPPAVAANLAKTEHPEWFTCQGDGDCSVVRMEDCCFSSCGVELTESTLAVNVGAQPDVQSTYGYCTGPIFCPDIYCAPGNVLAVCRSGTCEAIDLRVDELSACTTDTDCASRWGSGCCEDCGLSPIAYTPSASPPFCAQGGPLIPCSVCAEEPPLAQCLDGHCRVPQ